MTRRKKRIKKRKKSKKKIKKKRKKISKKKSNNSSNSEIIYRTKKEWIRQSLATKKEYEKKYNQSIKDNEGFWKKEGKRISWIKPYTRINERQSLQYGQ